MSTLIPKKTGTFWLTCLQQLSIWPLLIERHTLFRSISLTAHATGRFSSEGDGIHIRIMETISIPDQKLQDTLHMKTTRLFRFEVFTAVTMKNAVL
jgi:hypothetical protein